MRATRTPRLLLSLIAATTLSACIDEPTAPSAGPGKFTPQYDHRFDPSDATIAVNNYTLDMHGIDIVGSYKGQPTLFAGSLAYGNSATTVLFHNTANGQDDFSAAGTTSEVVTGGVADHFTSTLFAEAPSQLVEPKTGLGILTVRETYAYTNAEHDDYVIVKYSLTNTTATPITNLSAGFLFDPDFINSGNNVGSYDPAREIAIVRSGSNPMRHGLVLLGQSPSSYRSWVNAGFVGAPFVDPSTNDGWYSLISGGIDLNPSPASDIRQYLGAAPTTIAAGETRVVAFALLGGDDDAALGVNAAAARARYTGALATPRPALQIAASIVVGNVLGTAHLTFASAAQAAQFSAATTRCGEAAVRNAVVNGASVDVSFDVLALDDELRTGSKVYCAGRLSDGTYFAGFDTPTIDKALLTTTRLTTDPAVEVQPSLSPDGSKLVFGRVRPAGVRELWIQDTNGGSASAVRLTTGFSDANAHFTPDGARVVFSRNGHIHSVSVAGGATTQLTTLPGPSGDPHVLPDGRILFIRQIAPGVVHLFVMSGAGEAAGGAQSLIPGSSSVSNPELTADGSAVVFEGSVNDAEVGFYKLVLSTGVVTRISADDADGFQPVLSPDEKTLAFADDGKLVFQDMTSGLHTVALFDDATIGVGFNLQNIEFTSDGAHVIFASGNDVFMSETEHVVAPTEKAAELSASVDELVAAGMIPAAEGAQLAQRLADVAAKIEAGQLNAAVNNIVAFINKVNALVNSRRISQITGEQLNADANALIDQITGS